MYESESEQKHSDRWFSRLGILFVLAMILTLAYSAFQVANAATVNITWNHDQTTCADGSPGANCPTATFEVWQGTNAACDSATKVATGIGKDTRAHSLQNVLPGVKCWYVIAVGTTTGPSARSNVGTLTVPASPPKAPSITVTIAVSTSE